MRGRRCKSGVKFPGLTWNMRLKLHPLSKVEASGISSVAVKCVDIGRNTGGEGGLLDFYRRCGTKAWVANRIRYPGSPRRKR